MAQVKTEVSAKSNMRAGLRRAMDELREWRQGVRQSNRQAQREANAGPGFFKLTGANLAGQAIAKVGQAAGQAATDVSELVNAASELEVPIETLTRLQRAMEGSGVSVQELRTAMRKLSSEQASAKSGNEASIKRFAELGLASSEVKEMRLDELFLRVASGMNAMGDTATSSSAAMELLGTKGGKMVSTLREGGEDLKKAMDSASNAISEDNAKALDESVSKAGAMWSSIVGFTANKLGMASKEATKALELGLGAMGVGGGSGAPIIGASVSTPEQEAKKNAEAAAAFKGRVQNAQEEIQQTEKAIDQKERIAEADKEIASIRADMLKDAQEFLTLDQRQILLLKQKSDAQKEWNNAFAKEDEAAQKEATIKKAKAQIGLDDVREKKIQRNSMSAREKSKANKADRDAARDRKKGERVTDAKARDRIDLAFRDGRISKAKRDSLLTDLRARKLGGEVPKSHSEELLGQIKDFLKDLGAKFSAA